MRKLALVILVTFGIAVAVPCVAAAGVPPQQVFAHAGQYNGRQVAVTGTVEDFREKVSRRGNGYEKFDLCGDAACLHVFAWGHVPRTDGDKATLSGRFWAVKQVDGYTFYDELDLR